MMMKPSPYVALLALVFSCLAGPYSAATAAAELAQAKPDNQLCQIVACRPATSIKLKHGKSEGQLNLKPTPYVDDKGVITILAGETLYIEATLAADGNLTDLTKVDSITQPKKTLVISFEPASQTADEGMILNLKNPFEQSLVYQAAIFNASTQKLVPTSTCPVKPGLEAFESWPHNLFLIRMGDFHLSKSKNLSCR